LSPSRDEREGRDGDMRKKEEEKRDMSAAWGREKAMRCTRRKERRERMRKEKCRSH